MPRDLGKSRAYIVSKSLALRAWPLTQSYENIDMYVREVIKTDRNKNFSAT